MAVSRNDVLAALDQVIDPVSGRSVVQQDMVQGLVVRDGHVGFALEVDDNRGREAEPLRLAVEAAAKAVPGVLSVTTARLRIITAMITATHIPVGIPPPRRRRARLLRVLQASKASSTSSPWPAARAASANPPSRST